MTLPRDPAHPASSGRRPGAADIEELRRSVSGAVIVPDDARYEEARRVWNGAIDRRPALIVRCRDAADVVEALRFARSERLLVAVRGGGHNVAGYGTCDGGVVIDLSPMRAVRVDPATSTVRVEGGARWGDVDAATQAAALATPGGLVSTTGVGGLTLGGGIGWLSRAYGLTCDNLIAADLVTADGTQVRADERDRPELLWALRGGGGNFGIVTSFELRLHPVGGVLGGAILYPLEQAAAVLRAYRSVVAEAPDQLATVLNLMTVPAAPELPSDLHGRRVLAVGVCHSGAPEEGERAVAPLRRLGTPLLEQIAVMPYAVRQRLQDASAPAGLGNFWKAHYLTGLDDELIDLIVAGAARATSPLSQIHLYHLGGAIARPGADEGAYGHRSSPFLVSAVAVWDDLSSDVSPHVEWARWIWAGARPHADGTYVNFLGEEGRVGVRAAYRPGVYERLAAVKARYDPTNVFCLNHNVEPALEPGGGGSS